jgi:hypothetical protein
MDGEANGIEAERFIETNRIAVLNVACPRESHQPGILRVRAENASAVSGNARKFS